MTAVTDNGLTVFENARRKRILSVHRVESNGKTLAQNTSAKSSNMMKSTLCTNGLTISQNKTIKGNVTRFKKKLAASNQYTIDEINVLAANKLAESIAKCQDKVKASTI